MTRTPLPANVKRQGWVSFCTDVSSEMVYPILPLFVVGVLQAPAFVLGLIEGVAEAIVSVMKALAGWHSDRLRRRVPFLRTGYSCSALGKVLLAAATSWPLVFLARASDRFGKGLRGSAGDALIADSVTADQKGRAFGFHRTMDTAGALLGVMVTFLLLQVVALPLRTIFILAIFPALLAAALTLTLREPARAEVPAAQPGPVRHERLSGQFWRTLAVILVFMLGSCSDTFLLLRAKDLGHGDGVTVLFYALHNLSYLLSAYPGGLLSDRHGRWAVIRIGWALNGLAYLGFATLSGDLTWSLFLLYGAYMGLAEGSSRALIADLAPSTRRATALGIFHMGIGLVTLLGSTISGWLWDRVGHAAPFYFCGLLTTIGWLAIPFAQRARH